MKNTFPNSYKIFCILQNIVFFHAPYCGCSALNLCTWYKDPLPPHLPPAHRPLLAVKEAVLKKSTFSIITSYRMKIMKYCNNKMWSHINWAHMLFYDISCKLFLIIDFPEKAHRTPPPFPPPLLPTTPYSKFPEQSSWMLSAIESTENNPWIQVDRPL